MNSVFYFYPRSPRGERHGQAVSDGVQRSISIHAPREGSDAHLAGGKPPRADFYPRSPRGERRDAVGFAGGGVTISIHAPREGSDLVTSTLSINIKWISIHAPREGSDIPRSGCDAMLNFISIHAPREGSDRRAKHPLRPAANFYPRSPRGERPLKAGVRWWQVDISIHAPREGSDCNTLAFQTVNTSFLSTLPARGATLIGGRHRHDHRNFYPRSPRGERRGSPSRSRCRCPTTISIHAPREGSDMLAIRQGGAAMIFLSTLPARGATFHRCILPPTV